MVGMKTSFLMLWLFFAYLAGATTLAFVRVDRLGAQYFFYDGCTVSIPNKDAFDRAYRLDREIYRYMLGIGTGVAAVGASLAWTVWKNRSVKPSPHRRWNQFSLRTIFVGMTLVSIPLAWMGYSVNWIRQRREVMSTARLGEDTFVPYMPHVRGSSFTLAIWRGRKGCHLLRSPNHNEPCQAATTLPRGMRRRTDAQSLEV
jgi:hypothetical protein